MLIFTQSPGWKTGQREGGGGGELGWRARRLKAIHPTPPPTHHPLRPPPAWGGRLSDLRKELNSDEAFFFFFSTTETRQTGAERMRFPSGFSRDVHLFLSRSSHSCQTCCFTLRAPTPPTSPTVDYRRLLLEKLIYNCVIHLRIDKDAFCYLYVQ